jgi:hypothetical protein
MADCQYGNATAAKTADSEAGIPVTIFDSIDRVDESRKKLSESIFAYWNRSARQSSEASRSLIEGWFSRVPAQEQRDLGSRFCSGNDEALAAAFQELCLHELLLRLDCVPCFHPSVAGTTKRPDFLVKETNGSEFLFEARAVTEVFTGPDRNPRSNRVLDYLQALELDGFVIGVNELVAGRSDLPTRLLEKHIKKSLKEVGADNAGQIPIPTLETADGWKVRLIAVRAILSPARDGNVLYEAWARRWTGPSSALFNALKKKASRYGNPPLPFVIAVHSSDVMLTSRDFEDQLFGERGFWRTADAPEHQRVSAALFMKNLWPETLLMGQVETRLYLNPWAHHSYNGVLAKVDTFKLEDGSLRHYRGKPINELLKLSPHDCAWE